MKYWRLDKYPALSLTHLGAPAPCWILLSSEKSKVSWINMWALRALEPEHSMGFKCSWILECFWRAWTNRPTRWELNSSLRAEFRVLSVCVRCFKSESLPSDSHHLVCILTGWDEINDLCSVPPSQPTTVFIIFFLSVLGHCDHRNAVLTLWLAVYNNRLAYDVWVYNLWCASGAFRTKQY